MSAIFNLVDSWNASGTTFTAIQMNVTDTASAAGSRLIDLQKSGVTFFNVDKVGATFATAFSLGSAGLAADVFMQRDAANALALRNGTTAQSCRVYNTYTDASNYERAVIDWTTTANTLTIGSQNAGTGASRSVAVVAGPNFGFLFSNTGMFSGMYNGAVRGSISLQSGSGNDINLTPGSGGSITFGTDNLYDVGLASSCRPRYIRAASAIQTAALTVATLPAAATALAGARAFVTDGTVTASGNFGATVAGGGTNKVPVYSDGTSWLIG